MAKCKQTVHHGWGLKRLRRIVHNKNCTIYKSLVHCLKWTTVEEKTMCGWRRTGARSVLQKHDPMSVFVQRWAFATAGGEECKGLFLTHLPGDRLPFWRTTHSLLCVRLTIETRAPCSERPHIPDLGHNKSPTGSLFLIAATRSASRPSYKPPLPVLLVLVSRPHLHDDWWRQPEGGDTSSSSTRIVPVLLRQVGSCWNPGQWSVVPLLCSQTNGMGGFISCMFPN